MQGLAKWHTCAEESCPGVQVPDADRCLAHLPAAGLVRYLAALSPGARVDVRGTTLDAGRLARLLDAVRLGDGPPTFGEFAADEAQFPEKADFRGARFAGDAWFHSARFPLYATFDDCHFEEKAAFRHAHLSTATFERARFRDAWFTGARFTDDARFTHVHLHGDADFGYAKFGGLATFGDARFDGDADFGHADFAGTAYFGGTRFAGYAIFGGAHFAGVAHFDRVYCDKSALFERARFDAAPELGPLEAGEVILDRAVFEQRVEVAVEAGQVSAERARFACGATLRFGDAQVSLERAVLGGPSTVAALDGQPTLTSLREVDVAGLSVVDVDLRECRFDGARHLDQLRIEGRSGFGQPPPGVHFGRSWPPVWRWTRRRVLAEERPWRAWSDDEIVSPERLGVMYRALRKSLEDSKNEPGAADFYYGEMEMRRHCARGSDRLVLWLYWLLSGYGLRATRALLAAALVVAATTAVLVGWGLPHASLELALRTTVSAMAFRDPGPSLTPVGVWTVMAARLLGTVLLAMTVLAVRGRVKR